jgi:hypothetical protein
VPQWSIIISRGINYKGEPQPDRRPQAGAIQ